MSWVTEEQADAYLTDKPGTDAWFATGLDKTPYLTTAFRTINLDPDYTIPSNPDSDQLERLQPAQSEFAFYILTTPDYQKRQNLINQGVKSFKVGKFSENYETTKGRDNEGYSKYPVDVADLLRPFLVTESLVAIRNRDQEDLI